MSDIKLFRYSDNGITSLESRSATIEKSLQNLIERQMETILGVRLLASEYSTGKVHRGRIDSLGIDENNCPVGANQRYIIEWGKNTGRSHRTKNKLQNIF